MKFLPVRSLLFASVILFSAPALLPAQEASVYRRFSTRDNKPFYAVIVEKTATSVTLKLQSGKTVTRSIRELADPDQNYIRKWTKFKDALLNNAEFAKLTVKEMLELRGYQSFEFDIEGNHIFVEGEVNGKQMRFMVDTGADSSLIHSGSAEEAKLEIGPYDVEIRGVGGKAMAAVTKVPVLKLGDAVIENRRLLATDLFKTSGNLKSYDVIFGADFLRELDAVISYREGRMFLKPDKVNKPVDEADKTSGPKAEFRRWTKSDGGTFIAALEDKKDEDSKALFRFQNGKTAPLEYDKLSDSDRDVIKKWSKLRDDLAKNPEFRTLTVKELLELRNYQSFDYRLSGNHILVDGKVSDTKATFLIDTGAHGCVMHVGFAKKAELEIGPMDQTIVGIGGTAPAAITKVPSMKIGDAVIMNREVLSADLFKDAIAGQGEYDALFGADFLRELDAVISYKENRMFLRPEISDKKDPASGDTKKEEEEEPEEKEK